MLMDTSLFGGVVGEGLIFIWGPISSDSHRVYLQVINPLLRIQILHYWIKSKASSFMSMMIYQIRHWELNWSEPPLERKHTILVWTIEKIFWLTFFLPKSNGGNFGPRELSISELKTQFARLQEGHF